jgi:hypothetical protein
MGDFRDRSTQTAARSRLSAADADARPASFAQNLHRACQFITGDARQRSAFQAAPVEYLRRHSISVDHPEGARALAALLAVGSAGVRHADPSGEANAADSVVVAPSPIHGEGLFTQDSLPAGTPVCDVYVGDQISHPTSKINKSATPNAQWMVEGSSITMQTMKPIEPGEEVTADYPILSKPSHIPPPRSG